MGKRFRKEYPYSFIAPEKIKKICLISSPVMGLASCAYGWAGPAGAALGFVGAVLDSFLLIDINREYVEALDNALEQTKHQVRSVTQQKIIEELEEYVDNPSTLSEAIEKTETFQTRYCGKAEVKEILAIFEPNFRKEVAKTELLCKYYVLTADDDILQKLKEMNALFLNTDKKIDDIKADTRETVKEIKRTNAFLTSTKNLSINCISCFAFILISLAIFLIMGTFVFNYENEHVIAAPIALAITDFLLYSLKSNHYIFSSLRDGLINITHNSPLLNPEYPDLGKRIWKFIVTIIAPLLINVSCFWIILSSVGHTPKELIQPTIGLICGQMVAILLKESKTNVSNDDSI